VAVQEVERRAVVAPWGVAPWVVVHRVGGGRKSAFNSPSVEVNGEVVVVADLDWFERLLRCFNVKKYV
jgi:hypothetical protein